MSSREEILGRLRANVRETFDFPDLGFGKLVFDDPLAEFKRQTVSSSGARWMEMDSGKDINDAIREAFPDVKNVCSNVKGVAADLNPDEVDDPSAMEAVDVGVVMGGVAVAENACVWVPMDMKQKAVCFISQRLVIIASRRNVVSNMHDAYDALEAMGETSRYGFGTFISGPSKTADIQQALVYGAQAAREVVVLITE